MYFFITRRVTGEVLGGWAMLVRPGGSSAVLPDASLQTLQTWRSTRTFIEYPIALRVRVPSVGIDVVARATFPDQEVLTIISYPAFWEGTISVQGTIDGVETSGQGWLELKGFGHSTLDDFYKAVGKEVRIRMAEALPDSPEKPAFVNLMVRGESAAANSAGKDLGVDGQRLSRSLVSPIREITDREGKGWRSHAALACIDVVGGDSRDFLHWLIIPEMVHVGSLIVDDVEDESSVRRGGPACHLLYGTAGAINAGAAAYFLGEPPLDKDNLPDPTKLRIYRFLFRRHAGWSRGAGS